MPRTALPTVAVLATGGTIAGAQANPGAPGYTAATQGVTSLLQAVPTLSALANLHAEQVASVGSQAMTHAVWDTLARRIDVLCHDDSIDGIVVTHGTDTLEETAYFLSLVIPHDKPVVLVGAMRPATAVSADGPANLYNAVALATRGEACGRGPLVVMNDDIHLARDVQKTAAGGLCAFASPNGGKAGVIHGGVPCFHAMAAAPGLHGAFPIAGLPAVDQWPRVGIIYSHADVRGDVVDFMASRCDGLVLAGVGGGYTTDDALQALRAAAARGLPVVRASRTGSGHVLRNIELDDDAAGFVVAGRLSPQKARILLTLGLTSSHDPHGLQTLFDRA